MTETTVYVGASFDRGAGQANDALGAEGTDPGDARNFYNAVIADLNARGGLAGRSVEPLYFETNATSAETAESQQQAACTHWTEDNSVFAILDAGANEIYRECADDAGIFNISSGFSASTTATFERFRRYVEVTSVRLDRIGRVVVPGLHNQGYFDQGAVLGMVTWDHPAYVEAVETDFRPALASVGQDVQAVARITVPSTLAGVGDSQASISSAVLQFRSQGVSHVMILDGSAGVAGGTVITLLFLQTAESQAYRPRYGFNSTNSQANETRYLFPEAQLERAIGVTWSNSLAETDEGVTPNPQRDRCLQLMLDHGVTIDNVNAQDQALKACSNVWFLEAAVAAGGTSLTVDAVVNGIDSLGDRYRDAMSFGNRFAPDRRDGADLVRDFVDDAQCNCYRYPGPIYRP